MVKSIFLKLLFSSCSIFALYSCAHHLASFDRLAYEEGYDAAPIDNKQYVLNVRFYLVRNPKNQLAVNQNWDNPWKDYDQVEEQFLDAIALLNRTCNQFDIFFKYVGFQCIYDTAFENINDNEFFSSAHVKYPRSQAINVYVSNTINHGASAALSACSYPYVAIDQSCLNSASLVYAFGHSLGLDQIASRISMPCEFIPTDFPQLFSEQDGRTLRLSLANDRNGTFAAVSNSIHSLYRPYVDYPGGANRGMRYKHRPVKFQKGFNYQFVDPKDRYRVVQSYTVDEIPVNPPRNLHIKILQISREKTFNFFVPRP